MRLAVRRKEVLAAIGDQEGVIQSVRIDPVGRHLETLAIDLAHALGAQLFLHLFEEVEKGIPGLREIGHLVAGLFHQRPPHMDRDHGGRDGHAVKAALLGDVVIGLGGEQRGWVVIGLLRLHDIGHVDPLVFPAVLRNDLARVGVEQIGDDATG